MQYRRITEVSEDDEEFPSVLSSAAESSKANFKDQSLLAGPETLAEADPTDEDVAEFKRIQIVALVNVTGAVKITELDEIATILSASQSATTSLHPLTNISYKGAPKAKPAIEDEDEQNETKCGGRDSNLV
ncbi:hypothetical protein N7507_003344 [Penicillium longicatenatum]|nr:hypothetical protein N7507_003344 [Penicillium longicatenatum]